MHDYIAEYRAFLKFFVGQDPVSHKPKLRDDRGVELLGDDNYG
ncbi:MAG: hypothetical protein U0793_13035 [Gemmataceae bacterium]